MKKTLILAAVAALALGSSTVMSQDLNLGVGAGANGGVDANAGNMSAGASGNAAVKAGVSVKNDNYGALISSLRSAGEVNFSSVTADTTVNFVLLSSMQGEADANAAALDNALDADARAKLHADIAANAELKAKIEASHSIDDVLSISTDADGTFTVYIDDRA